MISLVCATLLRIIFCVIGARISSRTLIKWRIFTDAELTLSRNGYCLLNELGDPLFLMVLCTRNGYTENIFYGEKKLDSRSCNI